MIRIMLNGEPREVTEGISLKELIDELEIEPVHLAVEHNGDFIDEKTDWNDLRLQAGDTLEIVRFVGGG